MEIKDIITKSLTVSLNSIQNEELNELLKKFESLSVEEILNGENNNEIFKIHNEIREICNVVYRNNYIESECIIDLSKIISTIKSYLIKAVSQGDIKSVLIFLSVNCYLNIKIEDLLIEQEFTDKTTDALASNILNILLTIKSDIVALPKAPYHEKKLIDDYMDGFANDDIKKVYSLIEGLERNGRGLHYNYTLENLIIFLFKINYTYYNKVIISLTKPQLFVFYFQGLSLDDLIRLSKESKLNNKWLNFELIRQIIIRLKEEPNELNLGVAVKNILIRILSVDFDFFKQTIQYFHSNIILNASLGMLLISLTTEQIREVLSDCFKLDKYKSHIQARRYLLEYFTKDANEQQIEVFLSEIFNKWNVFLQECFHSIDFYQNELLISDFSDFIVQYYILFATNEKLLNNMNDLIDKIKYIDSEWAITASNQITKFNLYYSQLYLFSYAYKDKEINNSIVQNSFAEFKNSQTQINRYFINSDYKSLEIIEQNLNLTITS